jgi:mannosylglycerate hydrolase
MEKDSLYRADQIAIIGESLARRGMQVVQININNADLGPKDSVLTVFNPCPFPRAGVLSSYIDMPDGMGYDAFSIRTPDGKKKCRLQTKEQFPAGVLVRNLQDISIELRSKRVRCHIEVDEIPAFGYRTYHIAREDRFQYEPGTLAPEANVLENEHLRVKFNSDGTLDMSHKDSGRTFTGLHYLEDTGETGHTWIHMEPDQNETLRSQGFPCAITLEEAGPLYARMRVDYYMQIPVGIEDELTVEFRESEMNHTRRMKERREMVITSRFTLRAGQKRLDVTTNFENHCRNHRLRVVFPTRLKCDRTDSEASFDVIGRDIHVKKGNAYFGRPNPQYPMHRFVDMTDGKVGFAVVNNSGLREYEAMDTQERPLAITLLRAFTYRNCPIFGRWEVYPDMELAQCIGPHEWSYSLYPHASDWTQGVFAESEDTNLPLEAGQAGPHEGALPKSMSFVELEGNNLQLTALKQAEDRPGNYVVRIFNPTGKSVNGKLTVFKTIKKAWLTNMNEEHGQALKPAGKSVSFKAEKKKIVTLEFSI